MTWPLVDLLRSNTRNRVAWRRVRRVHGANRLTADRARGGAVALTSSILLLILAKHPLKTSGLVGTARLLGLQIRKSPGLSVNILHLLGSLLVELDNLLASRSVGGLLKVRAEASPEAAGTGTDSVGLVRGLGAVGGVELLVETLEGVEEAGGNTVLGVKLDTLLKGGITDDVSMSQVLGEDASAGLLLLCDVVRVAVSVLGEGRILSRVVAGRCDRDVVLAELGVVQQKSSLLRGLLLEGDLGRLGLALGGDLDVGNLAAEAEEITDLAIAGRAGDVLDLNGGGRHLEMWNVEVFCVCCVEAGEL